MYGATCVTCRSVWSPAQRPRRPSRRFCTFNAASPLPQQDESSDPEQGAVGAAAHPPLLARLRAAAGAVALSAALTLAPMAALEAHAESAVVSNDTPVVDLARVVPSAQLEGLQQQLRDIER